ncbi:MAG: D-arabinose 5-phosphate isomerase [Flavobacteriales bacterium CG_4_8_14_3_um_filter_35_10]|nr:MAG: D-arabinose 5-phosphate isomerase [Flavobacteriales bacterium CG_4_8_14_3_um_filter_35_10]
MNTKKNIINIAKATILEESQAIANLINLLDINFEKAVEFIFHSKGRVIVTGIGKSANIATKIVATFNSTGTPAIFMHAADAIHGDLGIVQKDDVVICISKSGNTPEIKYLLPLIKARGNKVIAITGNKASVLGLQSDFCINAFVEKEACPNNLAPTSSTTAQLVIGDALAVCLLELKDFNSTNFAQFHPGGALGKKLYLRVGDLINKNEIPKVLLNSSIKEVIIEISQKRLGATAVLNNHKIVGVITDGDIRRMLNNNVDFTNLFAENIMNPHPKTITPDAMATEAFQIMNNNSITQLLVENQGNYIGIIHLHDLLKEGIY